MIEALVRPARLEDAQSLHHHCYPQASVDEVRDYMAWCVRQAQKSRIIRLVAEVQGQAVGNAQLTIWGETGEIGSLVVAEPYRCKGLARQLLEALLHEAKKRGLVTLELGVSESQPDILDFYRRMGFQRIEGKKTGLSHIASPEPIIHLGMDL